MHITFFPQRRDDTFSVSKAGDVLTINGETLDFTSLPDGATIAAADSPSPWIVGDIERIDGKLHLALLLPHGANPSAQVAFPDPLIDPADGPIILPHDTEEEDEYDLGA